MIRPTCSRTSFNEPSAAADRGASTNVPSESPTRNADRRVATATGTAAQKVTALQPSNNRPNAPRPGRASGNTARTTIRPSSASPATATPVHTRRHARLRGESIADGNGLSTRHSHDRSTLICRVTLAASAAPRCGASR